MVWSQVYFQNCHLLFKNFLSCIRCISICKGFPGTTIPWPLTYYFARPNAMFFVYVQLETAFYSYFAEGEHDNKDEDKVSKVGLGVTLICIPLT